VKPICATINVSMDRKCAECRRGGATDSGICLGCTAKAMGRKPLRSAVGRAVQRRVHAVLDAGRPKP
jgi:hypothetical protein